MIYNNKEFYILHSFEPTIPYKILFEQYARKDLKISDKITFLIDIKNNKEPLILKQLENNKNVIDMSKQENSLQEIHTEFVIYIGGYDALILRDLDDEFIASISRNNCTMGAKYYSDTSIFNSNEIVPGRDKYINHDILFCRAGDIHKVLHDEPCIDLYVDHDCQFFTTFENHVGCYIVQKINEKELIKEVMYNNNLLI